jgi:hypothetical protein
MNPRRHFALGPGVAVACIPALLRAQASAASMRRPGWIEGQNIAFERVRADDQRQMLPRPAAERVARKSDLIYAPPHRRPWPRCPA